MMNIYQAFAMNNVQYTTWCYVIACHDGFMALDEFLDTNGITTNTDRSIQDATWNYVCDIHDPDEIWYTTL